VPYVADPLCGAYTTPETCLAVANAAFENPKPVRARVIRASTILIENDVERLAFWQASF
jgi:hypothetical protein